MQAIAWLYIYMYVRDDDSRGISKNPFDRQTVFVSAPAATVHYSNELYCGASTVQSQLQSHSSVDCVLSPTHIYIFIFSCEFGYICASCRESAGLEFIRMSVYIYIYVCVIYTLSPPLLLSSSLLFSPFLRASRFVYYYIFPFSCHRRHRFPMGVQSITLVWNAIALARHVYHWSRARSYILHDVRRAPFSA